LDLTWNPQDKRRNSWRLDLIADIADIEEVGHSLGEIEDSPEQEMLENCC